MALDSGGAVPPLRLASGTAALRRRMVSLLELISENQLHDEIVGALRQAEADAQN